MIQAVWARYAGQTVLALLLVAPRLTETLRTQRLGLQIIRSFFLLGATSFFFFSFARMPLANAVAVFNVAPLFIVMGASIFLGERFGLRRAVAIVVGFAGALIIIRPGLDVFSVVSLLPLGAAVSYTGYVLTTRFVGQSESPWTSLVYSALVGCVILSVIVPFRWSTPDMYGVFYMVAMAVSGTAGQLLLIRAYSVAEAGSIAPFTYSAIPFAMFWGVVGFGDYPDLATYLGTLVIVAAGLYVWRRETLARQEAATRHE